MAKLRSTATLTSAFRLLFRPWGAWKVLPRHLAASPWAVRLPLALALALLALVTLDLIRYALVTLLALLAIGLTVLIGVSCVGVMLLAVVFSGLVGAAFAARDLPAECSWEGKGRRGSWP